MDITKELGLLKAWLGQKALDPMVRSELEALKARFDDEQERQEGSPGQAGDEAGAADEIKDRFYRFMEFGTAGMRGVMGAGSNRINIHTLRKISQGYADYLNETKKNEMGGSCALPAKVAIAYDNRRFSDLYALEAALVFVANGIETHIFGRLSATPLLSYTVRELGTDGGVVVTASHNNKAYNGYKIYDSFGCQCMPDAAGRVAELIDDVDMWHGVRTIAEAYAAKAGDETAYEGATPGVLGRLRRAAAAEPLLNIISENMERAYIDRLLEESQTPGALENVSAVYTALNGAGSVPVQTLLREAGIRELHLVKEQELPDPDFTTAPEPNPEKPVALKLGIDLCEKLKAEGAAPDILIGTDPDGDRLGASVLHEGSYTHLSGNQVGVLLLDYIIACREAAGRMPDRPVFVTTIVSTPITLEMAKKHGVEARKVLTGFKNIGDQINNLETDCEEYRYIFGFEESCGYCSGVYCRDKDAQNTALLLLEALGVQKKRGKTLLDRMEELFLEYGYYLDGLDELVRPGEKGMYEIEGIMAKLRRPETLLAFGSEVIEFTDYQASICTKFNTASGPPVAGTEPVVNVPVSDVVEFALADGCRILARPSGTEPKLKIYYTGVGRSKAIAEEAIERMKKEIAGVVL